MKLCPQHGRLSCAECGVVPETREQMLARTARELADFMHAKELTRAVLEDAQHAFRVELERKP